MQSSETKRHRKSELLDRIQAARDSARIQLHLLSSDAQTRWHELETRLDGLQARLLRAADSGASTTALQDLTRSLSEIFREIQGTFELATAVRSFMTKPPRFVAPSDALTAAAQIMFEADCGAVPVVTNDGQLIGMITDRDLCHASYARGERLATIRVDSVMSSYVCTVTPEDTLGHVIYLLSKKRLRRLPVVEHGRLVGIVTVADIARHTRGYTGNTLPSCVALAHMLASISEPSGPSGTGELRAVSSR